MEEAVKLFALAIVLLSAIAARGVSAEGVAGGPGASRSTASGPALPITPIQLAQVSGAIPTDVTPSGLTQERQLVSPGFVFRTFQKIPARLWYNSTTEVTQRLETNVFFTAKNPKRDYVFRVLPNVTVGYNFLDNTAVYCNYFVIKDVYARHGDVCDAVAQPPLIVNDSLLNAGNLI